MKRVLIVSHADGDGHVIAEQVRRNLSLVPTFEIATVVDPVRTKNHKTWTKLDAIPEIDAAELVFFVDLMFAPVSFDDEADALVSFALERPATSFFVLDHHPLPLARLSRAHNLRPVYRPDVFDCTFGEPSWLMEIAALLEKQETRVRAKDADQKLLVKGIQRAAAIGGPLPGEKLLALMRFGCWDQLTALGQDDREFHQLPRGFRRPDDPISDLMNSLDKLATDLLKSPPGAKPYAGRSAAMSYDLDLVSEGTLPYMPSSAPSDPKDLAAIAMLLELAAIFLTVEPDASFSEEDLISEATRLGGDEVHLAASDLKIVMGKSGFLKRLPGKRFCLRA